MRVFAIQPEPFHTITYEAAGQAGRTETLQLPLFLGSVLRFSSSLLEVSGLSQYISNRLGVVGSV